MAKAGTATTTEATAGGCGECEEGWVRSLDASGISRTRRCVCRMATVAPGVPLEFHTARIKNYDALAGNEQGLDAAQEFLEALDHDPLTARDLYLFGGVGAGKTRLACAILNEAFAGKHRASLFARVPQTLLDLQRVWSGDTETRAEGSALIERMYSVPLLVLDDVGAEKGSDYTRRTLYTIYEARCDHGHRTIWTSNLGLAELKNFLSDDRLPSRLAGRSDVVHLACADQRMARR